MEKVLFLLVLTILPLAASADRGYEAEVKGIYYNFNQYNKTASVSYKEFSTEPTLSFYSDYSGDVTIPSEVNYGGTTYSVTSIGDYAFSGCDNLISVTIPESVTSIGVNIFSKCSSLTSVTIPNSVTSIPNNAFYDCRSLTSFTIPESVTSIGYNAFYYCSGLTSVNIPNSVTSIGDNAFSGCSSLTSLSIPNSVTKIGNYAFSRCSSIESVNVLCDPTSVGSSIFEGSSNMKKVSFDCKKVIDYFRGRTKITEIAMTDKVKSIGDNAFYYCSGLSSVNIPNSVTYIGSSAFEGCSGLTSVNIPNGVTSIGSSTFEGCSGLTSVNIPNSVLLIGSSAFKGCISLTSVDIPNGVTSIHDYAFNNCSGLTSVDIPNSVSWIGKYAFQNCTLLASVTIPNSVINIGDYAFSNCNNIESVSVLCDPKSVGSSIFEGCSNIKRVLFDCESVTDYFSQTKITEITMTDKVTSIGDNAFYYCSALTFVNIPNSVTSIGDNAFYGCSGLTSINIPYSVTSIGEYVFYGCDNLKSVKVSVTDLSTFCNNDIIPLIRNKINREVTLIDSKGFEIKILVIPDDVTSIGSQAFAGCRGLTSVIMGAGVKEIGPSAFYGIHPMKTIWMTNTPPSGYGNLNGEINFVPNDQFIALNNTVVYPFLSNMFEVDGVRYVPINPSEHTCDAVDCIYNESTKNVKISSHVNYKKIMFTVNQIQPYLAQNNHYIETLTLDYSDIPESAFSGCNGLTSVVVGKEVTSISEDAFRDCSSLTSVNISDLAAWCKIDFANNFSNPIYYAHHLFLNGNEIEKLVIPSSLTTIKNRTFYGCHGLTSVTIPSNVISIGDQAFAGCGGLTSFIIPNNVTSIGFNSFGGCNSLASVIIGDGVATIGDQAFYNCSGLTSVAIGDGVKSIGNYAFNNCSGLTSVSIGNNVTFIDAGAFNGCENLNSVQISDLVAWCKIRFRVKDNLSANPLYYAHHLFLNGEEIKDLEIPNGVTFIGENAFQCCIGLTSVTIPSSVTKISGHAFQGCRGLTSITIANGVTSIEENAFSSCIGLTSLTIPQSVETIGCDVFSGCNGLKQVIIQNRKTTLNFEYDDTFIGVSYPLFKSCPLEEIYIGGNIKINFRSQSEYGLEPLFSRKSTLQKVKIGGEATDIQKREFYGCKNLQDVIIGNKVATIGEEAFSGCSGLKTVELGTHVKDIGKTAFSGCTSMESITSKATAPPTCGSEALNDIDKWACNLFVPQGYLSAYQSADQWKTFYLMDDNIPPILSGDANCDNEVTIDDIKFIEDYIMGNIPDDFDEDAADFNGDGYINVADIVAIINYLKENK